MDKVCNGKFRLEWVHLISKVKLFLRVIFMINIFYIIFIVTIIIYIVISNMTFLFYDITPVYDLCS